MLPRCVLWNIVVSLITTLPITRALSAQTADLMRGSGAKQHGCMYVTFGPGIKPDDLEVTYVKHNSVKIALKGTEDSLLCGGFYIPALRNVARSAKFRFSDGTLWTFEDIDKRANLRALATPDSAGQASGPAPAPSPSFGRGQANSQPAPAPTPSRAIGQSNKCVVNGKILYTDGDCPIGATQGRLTSGATSGSVPVLPTLQRGSWKLNININGNITVSEYCGDPLDNTSRDVSEAQWARKLGCTVHAASSAPRSFNMVVDCPSDSVSEDGSRRAQKGRAELSVVSPTPQLLSLTLTRTAGNYRQTVEGTRVGSCE